MKIIKCPEVSEFEINGETFISSFSCSIPVRFLGFAEREEIIYLPKNYDEIKFIEDYKNNIAS